MADTRLIRFRKSVGPHKAGATERLYAELADLYIGGGHADDVESLDRRVAVDPPYRRTDSSLPNALTGIDDDDMVERVRIIDESTEKEPSNQTGGTWSGRD